MTSELWVAMIASVGVVISAGISYVVSKREIEKLKFQLKQRFVEELLKQRVENYPKIYRCISNCVKQIETGQLSKVMLEKTREEYNQLDASYALFFEPATITRCLSFRNKIADLIALDDKAFNKFKANLGEIKDFKDTIGLFELALQSEIGVHGIQEITQDGEIRRILLKRYDEKLLSD